MAMQRQHEAGQAGLLLNVHAPINNLPYEVFKKVCSFIEPVWLFNLSMTCKTMHDNLSFESANKIWYDAIPEALWKEAELYQLEAELDQIVETTAPQQLMAPGEFRHLLNQFNPARLLQFSPSPVSQGIKSSSWNATLFSAVSVQGHGYPVPSNVHPKIRTQRVYRHGRDAISVHHRRPLVNALGEPYQQIFNYKREIYGHLSRGLRCHLCLRGTGSNAQRPCRNWGLLFCSDCFEIYAVTGSAGKKAGAPEVGVSVRPIDLDGDRWFYLPEIDKIYRSRGFLTYSNLAAKSKAMSQALLIVELEHSLVEQMRTHVRRHILECAQKIWEGIEPYPVKVEDPITQEITETPQYNITADTFAQFRNRFAPTSKLAKFLFPSYSLGSHPTQIEYDSGGGWLDDPTKTLKRYRDFKTLGDLWVSDRALEMLMRLADCGEEHYDHQSHGGYVTSWVKAAEEYHIARLEGDLESGLIITMGHIPKRFHKDFMFRRVLHLRTRLGLQDEGSDTMYEVPQRPDLRADLSLAEFIELDRHAVKTANEYREKVQSFNKIIRATCVGCPTGGLLFHPMGLEGLVRHMRTNHRKRFWTKDDFYIIG